MSFLIDQSYIDIKELNIKYRHDRKSTQYDKTPLPIFSWSLNNNYPDNYTIPLAQWEEYYSEFPNSEKYSNFEKLSCFNFNGILRDGIDKKGVERDQTILTSTALKRLKKYHTCLIAAHCGYGKTVCAVYITLCLKFKTIVVCNIKQVRVQFSEAFKKFTNLKICDNVKKTTIVKDYDVLIIGPIMLRNILSKFPHFFDKFGTLIVDEVHTVLSDEFHLFLKGLFPNYLIGLSATPDKNDGLGSLLNVFFSPTKDFIVRLEKKPFEVYQVMTNFEPEISFNFDGSLNWTAIQNSIAYNTERHEFIIEWILKYIDKGKILAITKRTKEANILKKLCKDRGITADTFVGTQVEYNTECQVLFGGTKKIGVGFDSDRKVLMILSDILDIRQYEGRIREYNNIVIDFVDFFPTFYKHFEARKKWYKLRGAIIKKKTCTEKVVKKDNLKPSISLLKCYIENN